jgi:hypothetical protein
MPCLTGERGTAFAQRQSRVQFGFGR